MLDTIYMILDLAVIVLAVIYLVIITATLFKKEYSNVKNIKTRIVFTSILCILFILQIILSIILNKSGFSLGSDIFCASLWALNTVLAFLNLKDAQDVPSIELHIIIGPCFDDELEEGTDSNAEEGTAENTSSESNK